jgi:Cu2+-exporting ATPase
MSCCDITAEDNMPRNHTGFPSSDEMLQASRNLGDGMVQSDVVVDDVHCGGCIRTIEKGLSEIDIIRSVRLNLSTGWLSVQWAKSDVDPHLLFSTLKNLGYSAHLAQERPDAADPALKELLVSLGVAGFAAANIMLLSVSVWSGAEAATRDLFHWISALLAIPAVGFAGRPFFRPAFKAVRAARLNMDVPISLAVILALLMSIYETANHGEHAYFDASVTLLFFLLIGRTLDHVMRERARGAVKTLLQMMPRGAVVTGEGGAREYVRLEAIEAGMKIVVPLGERVPVDGRIISGTSDLDCSIVNGESIPVTVGASDFVQAGTLNLTAPIEIEATAGADSSFVAEITAMMEGAESGKQKYKRIADKAAAIYAPAVHILALATFFGWLFIGGGWHQAAYAAVAVLIITCPCALGLAVPIVQVVAAGKLFANGIMVKDGVALEKLADVDYAVFDKTGTLTMGNASLVDGEKHSTENMQLAASLASFSHHPYSRSISEKGHADGLTQLGFVDVKEVPGCGVEGTWEDRTYRLGRAGWALGHEDNGANSAGVVLSCDSKKIDSFSFEDQLRPAATKTIAELRQQGIHSEILSGDHEANVAHIAHELGDVDYSAGISPADKLARVKTLVDEGRFVLMVGDGINDAPALASAHVSIAPASAADVGRSVADMIFLRNGLDAVTRAIAVSKKARRLIHQNFGLAIAYNIIAVPLAVTGYATPLIAALAMSSSSILVTLNALRLKLSWNDEFTSSELPPAKENRQLLVREQV